MRWWRRWGRTPWVRQGRGRSRAPWRTCGRRRGGSWRRRNSAVSPCASSAASGWPCARPELQRRYNDLDFGGLSRQRDQIAALFTALGYEADRSFNALRGHQRMLFWDRLNDRQVDVVLDRLRMCHTLDFKDRLTVDALTVPLAELLLFKLQIVEANQKDIVDSITLLGDHPVGDRDGDCINAAHIARLAADDWGLHHTLDLSLERVGRHATSLAVDLPFAIEDQIACLRSRMEEERKSARWKMRARLGERMKWYELPEEVRG